MFEEICGEYRRFRTENKRRWLIPHLTFRDDEKSFSTGKTPHKRFMTARLPAVLLRLGAFFVLLPSKLSA